MSDITNPFSFETGMRSDFDGIVVLAKFEQNQNQRWEIHLTFDIDGELYVQRYGVGNDFASDDGGETLYHPDDNDTKVKAFHQNSAFASFIAFAMKTDAAKELVRRNDALYGGGNNGLRHAALWEGLGFHIDAVKLPGIRRDDETGKWVEGERALPTSGWVVTDAAVFEPAKKAEVATDISAEDLLHITAVAQSSGSISEFALGVMNLDAADGNGKLGTQKAIQSKLGDPRWFEALKNAG